jgi:REP element-mobilizing transposase RayT
MPITIFSTWTTYGTWLPGDERMWFERSVGIQLPDPDKKFGASLKMTEDAILLDHSQRSLVETTISDHCRIRKWNLHAVSCQSNHVHVLVTTPDMAIEIPREQFKAWCTRKLKTQIPERTNWWTDRGWDLFVDDEESLCNVIEYIQNQ